MLDEHVAGAVAAALQRAGIEAATVAELGRRAQADDDHLRFAVREGWVFVTYDRRVPAQAHALGEHAGVVLGRDRQFSVGALVRLLGDIAERETIESMRSQILYLQRSMLR
jgi:predicted nuclease of predicted toxin-antitoxin system